MKGKDVFTSKKSFALENAVPLANLEREDSFILNDFEVYFSKKYGSNFVVIQTEAGTVLYSWSEVIADKFKQLVDLDPEEWQGLELKLVEKTSDKGRGYFDLQAV